jgi:RNA polymerase sigma-70 factor (ECF subfamily)
LVAKQDIITDSYERYGPMVFRRAYSILGNHAEADEATQEVFIRAMNGLEKFDGRSKMSTWLYRVTTNFCLNKLRDRKRRYELQKERREPEEPKRSHSVRIADQIMLRILLAEADEQQAKAAICVYMDGMSHEEAADVLGVSRRTVGNLLDRFVSWARKRTVQPP